MTEWSTAESWLERTKAANRSSPAGYAWHEFWQWLERSSPRAISKPPMPFILAASAESVANKFHRLREQLRWAFDHGILAGAIAWLDGCPPDKWETHEPKRWSESFYPTLDDVSYDEGDDTD
jgi:hypothetical protein